jgi:hypothetical protein
MNSRTYQRLQKILTPEQMEAVFEHSKAFAIFRKHRTPQTLEAFDKADKRLYEVFGNRNMCEVVPLHIWQ